MGTAKDPRDQKREKPEDVKDAPVQNEKTSAQTKPENPDYKITDWASF